MKVFVAGATGALGTRAVRLLVAAGHEVTGVARTPEKAAALNALGASPARVGLFEPGPLGRAVSGHAAVVNLATHIPELAKAARSAAWEENDRIRTEASRNLVDAALAAGAQRFVQESVSFFYADCGADWVDEDTTLEVPDFARSLLVAESQAARFADAGGAGVVLRFGWFYGAGASHTASQLGLARKGLSAYPGAQGGYQTQIHLDDAAAAVVAALRAPSGVYNVTEDEPATRRELAAAMGAALGKRPGLAVPGAARLGGKKTAHLERSTRVSNRRFRAASGWAPAYPTSADGWRQVVGDVTSHPQ